MHNNITSKKSTRSTIILINGIYVGQRRVQLLFGFLMKLSGFEDEKWKWPAICLKLRAIYVNS